MRELFGGPDGRRCDWMGAVRSLPSHYKGIRATQEFREALRGLARRSEEPFELFVVGEGNNGKSTLINALFGQELSSVHFLPTTRAFLRFVPVSAPAGTARVFARLDGSQHNWLRERLPPGKPARGIYQAKEHLVQATEAQNLLAEESAKAGKKRGYSVALVEIEFEVARGERCLVPEGVRVVDTQGLNQLFPAELLESDEQLDARTTRERFDKWLASSPRGQHLEWQLRRCDAVLWVGHARRSNSAVCEVALRLFAKYGKRTILALNRIDEVGGPKANRHKTVDAARRSVGEFVDCIVPLDARAGMSANVSGDESAMQESGLRRLADDLDRIVFERRGRVRAQSIYVSARVSEDQQRKSLRTLAERARSVDEDLSKLRSELLTKIVRARSELESAIQSARSSSQAYASRALGKVTLWDDAASVTQRLGADVLQGDLAARLQKAVDHLQQVLEQVHQHARFARLSLPSFDAEGDASGATVSVCVDLPFIHLFPRTTAVSVKLEADWVGVLVETAATFFVDLLGSDKNKAERNRERAAELKKRKESVLRQVSTSVDATVRPFEYQVVEQIDRFKGDLTRAMDDARSRIEAYEGCALSQLFISIEKTLQTRCVSSVVAIRTRQLGFRIGG